jgi:hypothetical protein
MREALIQWESKIRLNQDRSLLHTSDMNLLILRCCSFARRSSTVLKIMSGVVFY